MASNYLVISAGICYVVIWINHRLVPVLNTERDENSLNTPLQRAYLPIRIWIDGFVCITSRNLDAGAVECSILHFSYCNLLFFPFWIKRATRERELVTFADTIDLWFVRFTGLGYIQCCFWAVLDCAFYYETSGCDDDQMRGSLPWYVYACTPTRVHNSLCRVECIMLGSSLVFKDIGQHRNTTYIFELP